jgi:uncharacterized membrane protein
MNAPEVTGAGMSDTLRQNIARLSERQRQRAAEASASEKLADVIMRFTGSMTFVAVHLVLFAGWIVINIGWVPGVPPFDPTLVVLAMAASVEAIFLSTFVLMSQNRMAESNRNQAELDLHINLLAEHELTRVADLVGRIAHRLNIPIDEATLSDIKRDVEPVQVMEALETEHDRDDHI